MANNQVERLFQAIQSSDLEQVRELLNSGFHPNSKNSNGHHPLVLAASLGNVNIVDELLKGSELSGIVEFVGGNLDDRSLFYQTQPKVP